MAGVLVVLGGEDFDREVFRHERRGNWSAAFPLVLEKYGFLDVEVAEARRLALPDALRDHGCVWIGRLPESAWTAEFAEMVIASGRPTYVEPPVPRVLAERLGLAVKPAKPVANVAVLDPAVHRRAAAYGMAPGGRFAPATVKPIDRDSRLDWQAIDAVPLTDSQAEAWRAIGWDIQVIRPPDESAVLAEWYRKADGPHFPALVRSGSVVVSAVGLMSYLGQMHTSEPAEAGAWRTSRRVTGLETLALGLIDTMLAEAGRPRVRVLPWPDGASWVLNVRHDFDRDLPPQAVEAVLAGHARGGTAATWYWRARHLGRGLARWRETPGIRAVRLVAAADRHEVAHHTERLWCGAAEEERAISETTGTAVRGTSAHGDPTCFRYQGAANVLWAASRGLLYTELIQHAHFHPHRFAAMGADGVIAPLDVICLPHHHSFDLSMRQGDTNTEAVVAAAPRFSELGGMLQVMNHPDLHPEMLFDALARMPRDGRLDWTAAETADWWRRTHTLGALRVDTSGDGRVTARAEEDVAGLKVEILQPDGSAEVRAAEVAAGEARPL